jgi:serine/threonine protein kinase
VRVGASASRQKSRYVLGELLGRGGMAEVFAGQALGSHGFAKPVAIKRLLPEHAHDEGYVDRLIDEAKLLVAMQHGNIVSVLDLVRESNDVFLVMEFIDGPSLRQLLQARPRGGALPIGIATYVVQAAATGLEFAHVRPGGAVIHADISPSNLLLTTSGEVKVADFGIARREGVGTAGVVEGKWAYMAPEQTRGEVLTARADVFALGVVLYELITGVHPFARKVSADGRDEAAALAVVPPRIVRPEIPHALDQICMRAISHDPRHRLASMQQLVDGLNEQRFANGWRDGAAELAQLIRELRAVRRMPVTTERAPTIITRSLLGGSQSGSEPDDDLRFQPPGTPHPRADGTPSPVGPATRPATPSQIAHALAAGTGRQPIEAALEIAVGLPSGSTIVPGAPAAARWRLAVIVVAVVGMIAVIAAATVRLLASDVPAVADRPRGLPAAGEQRGPAPIVEPIIEPAPQPAPPAPTVTPPVTPVVPERVEVAASTPPTSTPSTAPARPARKPASGRAARAAIAAERSERSATGTLRISSVPWAYATVDGQTYETPASGIKLAPGTHVVKLHSPDSGLRQTRKVTIVAGKLATLSVRMGEHE